MPVHLETLGSQSQNWCKNMAIKSVSQNECVLAPQCNPLAFDARKIGRTGFDTRKDLPIERHDNRSQTRLVPWFLAISVICNNSSLVFEIRDFKLLLQNISHKVGDNLYYAGKIGYLTQHDED